MKKTTTNDKVNVILDKSVYHSKVLLSKALGISRPTLDSRIKGESKWKRLEEFWINHVYNKLKL